MALLESVVENAPAVTVSSDADNNIAWRYGLRLINEGFYWEAHEVLEAVWMHALPNSRERFLVQGIIHCANAALKIRMDREPAAYRLSLLAAECIERAFQNTDQELMGLPRSEAESLPGRCTVLPFFIKLC